jgi:hypothetical protein
VTGGRSIGTLRTRHPFEPRFFERDARFWPIARAAGTFADAPDWPEVESYARAFAGEPAVRFERQAPRTRRKRRDEPADAPLDAAERARAFMYDARIVQGVVPTRHGSWHDFLNALVWATFPRAKAALHARQHAAVAAWAPPGARTLPNARTREMDALALIDEGGVVFVGARMVLFGHALYEGLVLGVPSMIAREAARVPHEAADDAEALRRAEDALLVRLAGPLAPEELGRAPL